MDKSDRRPWLAVVVVLAAGAVAVVGPFLALFNELPDPLATHWESGLQPDGFTSRAVALYMTLGWSL